VRCSGSYKELACRPAPSTPSPPPTLWPIARIRNVGYAIDNGDRARPAVAAPIHGLPSAYISISRPGSRVTLDQVAVIAPEVRAAAEDLRTAFHGV
jgi:DNA-binding IclR family transcriptional regulator